MPNGFPRGLDINPATNILAQSFLQQGQQNDAQSAFKNFLDKSQMIPTQNLPPVGNGQSVPTSPTDPGMLQALSQLLVNPYGKELYGAYQGQQPQYDVSDKGIGGVDIIKKQPGIEPTVKEVRPPMFRPTNPTEYSLAMDAENPNSSTAAQSRAALEGIQNYKKILATTGVNISAPTQDEHGNLGNVQTPKGGGEAEFVPTKVKGKPNVGSAASGNLSYKVAQAPIEADARLKTMLESANKAAHATPGENIGAYDQNLLMNHIGMTLGLQKGARITRDVIREAVDARSLSDKMLVMWDRVQSGAGLSPAQRQAFLDLAQNRRVIAWQEAKRYAEITGVKLPKLDKSLPPVEGYEDDNSSDSQQPTPSKFKVLEVH